jgi:hypothetical protein
VRIQIAFILASIYFPFGSFDALAKDRSFKASQESTIRSTYRYRFLLIVAENAYLFKNGNAQWKHDAKVKFIMGKNTSKPISVILIRGTGYTEFDKRLVANFSKFNKFDPVPKIYPKERLPLEIDLPKGGFFKE